MRVSPLLTGRGQEGLELPGSDTAHSLKTAKLPGGMGLNSWGFPSLRRAGLTLPTDLGPVLTQGRREAPSVPEQGSGSGAGVPPGGCREVSLAGSLGLKTQTLLLMSGGTL